MDKKWIEKYIKDMEKYREKPYTEEDKEKIRAALKVVKDESD